MHAQRGFTLVETAIGVAILALLAAGAIGAAIAGSRVSAAPAARDRMLTSVRNAIVETRAAAAYDPAAASAILAADPQRWNSTAPGDATQFATAVEDGALVFTAVQGSETVRMRYPVVTEALPQGAIVDEQGNVAGP